MDNPDDPAALYFRRAGIAYRVKAFDQTVWIEAQPGGDNLPYERAAHPVFDGQTWDLDALAAIVDIYRADCGDAVQQPASGQQGRKSARPRSCRRRKGER